MCCTYGSAVPHACYSVGQSASFLPERRPRPGVMKRLEVTACTHLKQWRQCHLDGVLFSDDTYMRVIQLVKLCLQARSAHRGHYGLWPGSKVDNASIRCRRIITRISCAAILDDHRSAKTAVALAAFVDLPAANTAHLKPPSDIASTRAANRSKQAWRPCPMHSLRSSRQSARSR